jgi:hypothetical protein
MKTFIEWTGGVRTGFKEIGCKGGKTPDEQVTLVAHKFGRVMEINDWQENDADGVIQMDGREA